MTVHGQLGLMKSNGASKIGSVLKSWLIAVGPIW